MTTGCGKITLLGNAPGSQGQDERQQVGQEEKQTPGHPGLRASGAGEPAQGTAASAAEAGNYYGASFIPEATGCVYAMRYAPFGTGMRWRP